MRIVTFLLVFQFVSDHPFIALIFWWFLKGTNFSLHLIFLLHLNKLVNLSALCLGCVYGKYMICTMCLLYWQTMCISLLKCLSISHSSLPVEQVLICCFLFFVAQLFMLQVLVLLFAYLCSLARVCVKKSRREWGFHVMHTTLKCKSYLVHVPWGVPSYFL